MTFIGLQALIDPPRQEAITAVQKCHTAGIRVKMITGDHARTASSIAQQVGRHKPTNAVTGKEIATNFGPDDLIVVLTGHPYSPG